MTEITITALPAFTDNYIWVIHDSTQAWVVDPGQAQPVFDFLAEKKLALAGILITHKHADHVGGVAELYEKEPVSIWQPKLEMPVPWGVGVVEGDTVQAAVSWTVLEVPGHTEGHIAYYSEELDYLFCGDTLFSAGCGRLLGGRADQLFESLRKIARLPGATRIACAHEYTLNNLRFAHTVEPRNGAILEYQAYCQILREHQRMTLPSTLEQEKQVNPFLRVDQPSVLQTLCSRSLKADTPLAAFTSLRQWKDTF